VIETPKPASKVGISTLFNVYGQKVTYGTGAEVANPSHLHNIVQSAHNFFPRYIRVHPLDLKNVNVRAKSLHTSLYGIKDVLP
jgi:hypothetical protein